MPPQRARNQPRRIHKLPSRIPLRQRPTPRLPRPPAQIHRQLHALDADKPGQNSAEDQPEHRPDLAHLTGQSLLRAAECRSRINLGQVGLPAHEKLHGCWLQTGQENGLVE